MNRNYDRLNLFQNTFILRRPGVVNFSTPSKLQSCLEIKFCIKMYCLFVFQNKKNQNKKNHDVIRTQGLFNRIVFFFFSLL